MLLSVNSNQDVKTILSTFVGELTYHQIDFKVTHVIFDTITVTFNNTQDYVKAHNVLMDTITSLKGIDVATFNMVNHPPNNLNIVFGQTNIYLKDVTL